MRVTFLLLFILFVSCDSSDDMSANDATSDDNVTTGNTTPSNENHLHQFTPDQANWSTFYSKPLKDGFKAHDPDSWTKFELEEWEISKWNGEVYDPSKMTKKEFAEAICPDVDMIRGLRELFYKEKPFKDNANPTKAEVDEWHRIAINHIRSLVGYTEEEYQIAKDSCLFIRALWADQRKFTDMWDAKYPKNTCSGGIHCGFNFTLNEEDRKPYFAEGHSLCKGAPSEGVFVRARAHIPWSTKFARPFCESLHREGFWGGHIGPWFHRTKFGFSFWDKRGVEKTRSYAILRAKWGGKKMPSRFTKPN